MKFKEFNGKQFNILVTGGAGFIGTNLSIALLRNNQNVFIMDNFSTGKRENIEAIKEIMKDESIDESNLTLLEGDLCDLDFCITSLKDIDYVVHNGALGSVPRSIKDPVSSTEANVMGTLNIFFAAKENKVKRVIFASSSSVYGDSEKSPKKEGDEGELLSPYAVTKAVNELYAQNFYKVYGLETIGLRYFNVFGPYQDPFSVYAAVVPLFVKAVLNNEAPLINGDGSITRDFTYIENVIQVTVKAIFAGTDAVGTSYNVACGEETSLNDIYTVIASLLNSDIKPTYGPLREGDILKSLANIDKAKKFLNYDPKVTVKEGMEKAIDWYKENL